MNLQMMEKIIINKKGQNEIFRYAVTFIILFIIGGIIGVIFLPHFPGRFYISGLIFGIFGTGAGAVLIKIIFNR